MSAPDLARLLGRSLDCVHCGLCLSACPTYRETGREPSSPRGRVYLMRAAAEGRTDAAGLLAEEAFLCLGCRACETACPSGVEYGAMLEQVRFELVRSGRRSTLAARVERALLRHVVAHRGRLRLAVDGLRLAQQLSLERLAGLLPTALRRGLAQAPRVPRRAERGRLPELVPAEGTRRGRVALFEGCLMSELYAHVHRALARVLSVNGFDVLVPRAQTCCGALQAHAGDLETATALARRNARIFEPLGVDAVVVDSVGCGAAMREARHWLGAAGATYADLVRDPCELLDAVGLRPPTSRVDARVCYDDPCHLVHAQRVEAAPRRLLAQVPGLELVPHADAGACCGAAGTYGLTHPEMSERVLARKLDHLIAADPDLVATGNPGCLLQIAAGLRQRGHRARAVHPVELLARAYDEAAGADSQR